MAACLKKYPNYFKNLESKLDMNLEDHDDTEVKHVEKRETGEPIEENEDDEYSLEEMNMMHDGDDNDEEIDDQMSIIDDNDNATTKEWHINLFGEIVHDELEHEMLRIAAENEHKTFHDKSNEIVRLGGIVNASDHEVTELLFHPANFKSNKDVPIQDEMVMEQVLNKQLYNNF